MERAVEQAAFDDSVDEQRITVTRPLILGRDNLIRGMSQVNDQLERTSAALKAREDSTRPPAPPKSSRRRLFV